MDLKEEKRYTTGGASQVQGQLVAKGFTQMDDMDYNEIFSHVVQQTSIRIIIFTCNGVALGAGTDGCDYSFPSWTA